MLGVEGEVDEEQKEAYNDAGPMGRLPGQQRGANGNHEEGHPCYCDAQKKLEQSDQQRKAAATTFLDILQ